ncbi:hypothetical protein GDO81_026201 [Engystomops pustulosus]|uniref:Uncharacterized protein n=1 Tax=Engystomops pustulosus TaxID=76066 RepID=A0AAV6ZGE0_ENGPU|nr:hypothetical protein GDO81_026201 [Engystomops pustulosus]
MTKYRFRITAITDDEEMMGYKRSGCRVLAPCTAPRSRNITRNMDDGLWDPRRS